MNFDDLLALGAFILGIAFVIYLSVRPRSRGTKEHEPRDQAEPASYIPVHHDAPRASFGLRAVPVTVTLIGICLAVAMLTNLGKSYGAMSSLLIADPDDEAFRISFFLEIWRLVTPIFLHFGILHLVFNMIWLWDLGSALERIKGHRFLLGFVLATGIAANVAQFVLSGSALFGGMSGVIYGFLGYIWVQGRRNPAFGIALSQQSVVIMLGWFVLCWMGVLGPVANWAHTAGLVLGAALGAQPPRRKLA